jgi:hypothetical protein
MSFIVLSTMEASAIVCDRGVRWRRRSGDRRQTRWAMPQKNAASMMRQNDKGAATMIKQPALAPSPQPRPAPTARALTVKNRRSKRPKLDAEQGSVLDADRQFVLESLGGSVGRADRDRDCSGVIRILNVSIAYPESTLLSIVLHNSAGLDCRAFMSSSRPVVCPSSVVSIMVNFQARPPARPLTSTYSLTGPQDNQR